MLIANLLAEAEWAEVGGGDGSPTLEERGEAGRPVALRSAPSQRSGPPGPPASRLPMGNRLAAASAVAGSLMRVLARDEREMLWLPALPVDLDLPALPGLPRPRIGSARDLEAGDDASILAWAETPWVAGLRGLRNQDQSSAAPIRAATELADQRYYGAVRAIAPADFASRLRHIAPPTAAVAARANHRAFSLELATHRGWALPGEAIVHDFEALARHLHALAAGGAEAPAWVLKAAWSAAGRDRLFGSGAGLDDPALRARIHALLERSPALRLEPWMQRETDFGCVGLALPEGPRLLGMHRLHCDRRGVFRAIELSREPDADRRAAAIGLGPGEQEALLEAFSAAGEALAGIDYRGPYGIDAWRYRGGAGLPSGFRCLGEINARLTMGHLAHLLVDRLAPAGGRLLQTGGRLMPSGDDPAQRMRLELGRRAGELPPGTHRLASAGGFVAWLAPASAETA